MQYSDYPGIKIPYVENDIEHLMDLILELGKALDSGNVVSVFRQANNIVDERLTLMMEIECKGMDHYNAWCKQVGLK